MLCHTAFVSFLTISSAASTTQASSFTISHGQRLAATTANGVSYHGPAILYDLHSGLLII